MGVPACHLVSRPGVVSVAGSVTVVIAGASRSQRAVGTTIAGRVSDRCQSGGRLAVHATAGRTSVLRVTARASSLPCADAGRAGSRSDRGTHRGGLDAVEALLVDLPDDPVARHGYEVLGDLHIYRGSFDASVECFRQAERLAHRADDRFTVLHSRMSQAMALGYGGQVDEALALLAQVRVDASDARIGVASAWCDFTEAELVAETVPQRALELVDRSVEEADRSGWRMLADVGRLTASSLRARTADPVDAIPGFERLIRHWSRHGDDTHQWTTLRNLVDLFIRLEAYAPAARLLGAVSVAPRPTFGAEEQRLTAARTAVLHHLAAEGQALILAGTRDDLPTAVEFALSSLGDLRRVPRA